MDRMKRIKSWKAFESAKGRTAKDALNDVLDALDDVYMLCLDSIDRGGQLCAMCTIDNLDNGGDDYIFSTRFDSTEKPGGYTFGSQVKEKMADIQRFIDGGAEITVGVCLTMVDEDDMEMMDIEATYLLEESMDELNLIRPGIHVKTLGPYDYQENFDYF